MTDEVRYYKGRHKVRVLTQSKGYWIVEALEPFEDELYGKVVKISIGERRMVAPNLLYERKGLPPPIKEHVYELKMEKKLKRIVTKEEMEEQKDKL